MEHTFCLVIDKNTHELVVTKYFMNWLKETVEFILPNNTLNTPEEFFEMMKRSKEISSQVSSAETNQHILYYIRKLKCKEI